MAYNNPQNHLKIKNQLEIKNFVSSNMFLGSSKEKKTPKLNSFHQIESIETKIGHLVIEIDINDVCFSLMSGSNYLCSYFLNQRLKKF